MQHGLGLLEWLDLRLAARSWNPFLTMKQSMKQRGEGMADEGHRRGKTPEKT